MAYTAPTWNNDAPPAITAEAMQEISDNLEYVSNNICNRNLLHNWYFGNPVNQRGKTVYSGAGFTVDRWQARSAQAAGSRSRRSRAPRPMAGPCS